MKINERYSIEIVIIEVLKDGNTGDCDIDLSRFLKEHPFSNYKYGFVVVDNETGLIPDTCNDWNDSIDDAIADWTNNAADNDQSNSSGQKIL